LQTLLGKGGAARATVTLHGDEFLTRKQELMRAFSDSALEVYWKATLEICAKYAASWNAKGKVQMAKELDDMAMEITARCLIGATDQGHIHKLRTIMGGGRCAPPQP